MHIWYQLIKKVKFRAHFYVLMVFLHLLRTCWEALMKMRLNFLGLAMLKSLKQWIFFRTQGNTQNMDTLNRKYPKFSSQCQTRMIDNARSTIHVFLFLEWETYSNFLLISFLGFWIFMFPSFLVTHGLWKHLMAIYVAGNDILFPSYHHYFIFHKKKKLQFY